MVLSNEDNNLFFTLWFALLEYVNLVYEIFPNRSIIENRKQFESDDIKKLSDALFDDVSIIDDFLDENKELFSQEQERIIRRWKRFKRGKFYVERHLKKGSIFISPIGFEVYLVNGLAEPWENLLGDVNLPTVIEATLIPFKNVIISDGLIKLSNISLKGNYKRELKEIYIEAKQNGKIHSSL